MRQNEKNLAFSNKLKMQTRVVTENHIRVNSSSQEPELNQSENGHKM